MTGKEKCTLLKQIRKEIADKNGIAFEPAKCTLVNPQCLGTCPRCDEEIRYLDAQLNRKAQMGGKLNIAGVSPEILKELEKSKPVIPFFGGPVERPGEKSGERPYDPRRTREPEPWPRKPEGPGREIYQTMGLMINPEMIHPGNEDDCWDEEDEED